MHATDKNDVKQALHVYQAKLQQRQAELSKVTLTSGRIANARLIIFIIAIILAWLSLFENHLSLLWALAVFAVFILAVQFHSRIIKQQKRAQRAIQLYSQRLDHIAGQWSGKGNPGNRYSDADHPYLSDLDIFGEGSLFEFLCGARTRMGEDMLAAWLSCSADLQTIERRQQALAELRDQLAFREEIFLLDTLANNELDQTGLRRWIEQAQPIPRWQRVLAAILGVAALASIVAWSLGYGYLALLLIIALEVPLYTLSYRNIRQIASGAEQVSTTLATLVQVLELIEQKQFETPLLQALQANLQSGGHAPSWQINRLHSLINQLSQSMLNQLVMPVAFLFGIPIHLAHRIEQWHQRIGPHISQWLDSVGQIEALNSLAMYAFEHPNNPFPEMLTETEAPCFNAVALGHPLIPALRRIDNDIRIDSEQRLIMVSGSNMSGKSTLLRAIGVNVVLACCGAPVQAKSLKTSCFLIGSAMRASDSLTQGSSFFYAVISRIKRVVELAGRTPPLLFLLDEILQGTNSHDRLIGAKGIIHYLIDRNAVGLVTTHDLALTKIVDALAGRAINIHFKDHIEDGRICFDYKICPGVIQKSNGLELMRMVGLNMDYEMGEELDMG